MTGFQTERVTTKTYLVAVSVLLRIAKAVFDRAMREPFGDTEDSALAHWFALRQVAQMWLATQSTVTGDAQHDRMCRALRFAHEMAHEAIGPVMPVKLCGCLMAADLRTLAGLHILGVAGVDDIDAVVLDAA